MAKKIIGFSWKGFARTPVFWLLLMLAVGGSFRFYNLDWDFQQSFHPDERNILGAVAETKRDTGYRVTFFAYGQLPVYLYRASGELLSTPAIVWKAFNGKEGIAEKVYWLFLILVAAGAFWAFPREEWKVPSFGVGAILFLGLITFKFFDIFSIWFDYLRGFPLRATGLGLVSLVSLGTSLVFARSTERKWVGPPLYVASGATFLLGVLPLLLPDVLARTFATLAFTLLVSGLFLGLAWVSRWGRLMVGLLSLWAILASFPHAGRQYGGYGEAMIVGRWWSAFFSTATIAVIYGFGRKAFGRTDMALTAAALFAFAAVSVEQAHYCITESFITFMFMVVLFLCYNLAKEGSWKNYLLAGGAFGFAMAAKTSALYYVLIIVAAHLVLLSRRSSKEWIKVAPKGREQRLGSDLVVGALLAVQLTLFFFVGLKFRGVIQDLFGREPRIAQLIWLLFFIAIGALGLLFFAWGVKEFKALRGQVPYWSKLVAAGGLSFFIFFLFCPWSLLDLQGFMGRQNYEWDVVSIADACYVLQFKDTPRYLFHLLNLMHVELWWPLGVTAVLGMVWIMGRSLVSLFRPTAKGGLLPVPFLPGKRFDFPLPEFLILAWFIPYFGFIGAWNTKFIRYVVPLVPAFCIFGTLLLWKIFDWAKRKGGVAQVLKPTLLAIVIGGSFLYSTAYMSIYTNLHTWLKASVWIFQNVPAGSSILTEEWDDGLPKGVDPRMDKSIDRSRGPHEYKEKGVRVYELYGNRTDDSQTKKNDYLANLQQGQYLSIASKKLWYTLTDCTPEFRPKGFNIYPVTSRYYRALWSGLLGYKMVAEFHSFPKLFGIEHPDDMAEESFSVYDHPRAYIFKKVEDVPAERILELLGSDEYVAGIDRARMRTITPDNVEAFIQERRKYLEEKGLWKKLEEVKPAEATPVVSSSRPEQGRPRKSSPATQPTPEALQQAKIQPPITGGGKLDARTLQALETLTKQPVEEPDLSGKGPLPEESTLYQWKAWFTWLLLLLLLGWIALPWSLRVFSPFPSGAYSLSKFLGFFIFAWCVWFSASLKVLPFTQGVCWVWLLLLAGLSLLTYWKDRVAIKAQYARWGKAWWVQEGAFLLAFAFFSLVKVHMPHIHDPVGEGYNGGGEAGMDFGFLASVVRGESFPPQNMWMAGLPIGYTFYYGHLMMGILTKTLGLVPAVTYNLALITLFAAIFSCAFGLAFAFSGRLSSGWIAGTLCALAGNPAGAKQLLNGVQQFLTSPSFDALWNNWYGLWNVILGRNYDYFGPTRVIPFGGNSGHTINEFPYFSVLYGDMHAHTLAQPFAMLILGVGAALYLSPSASFLDPRRQVWTLGMAGLLLGGISFLNTWEVPVWVLFLGLALLVRGLAPIGASSLHRGLLAVFICILAATTLLGWFHRSGLAQGVASSLRMDLNPNAVGGSSGYFLAFLGAGAVASIVLLRRLKGAQGIATRLLRTFLALGGVLLAAGLLWSPFFSSFEPQQNKIMWVKPDIRTSVWNYFNVYGFFLIVLLVSPWTAYLKPVLEGLDRKEKKAGRFDWAGLPERLGEWFVAFLRPGGSVKGMLGLGVLTLLLFFGASWVHWVESPTWKLLSQAIATLAAGFLGAALWARDRWGLWMGFAACVLFWATLLAAHILPLSYGVPLTLGLGFFSILWLLAFLHLGLAVKTFADRGLSFGYFLVSFFFFATATLEIYVMSEYFGFGDGMRNNSMFKYGIVAWTLASVATGVFLPQVLDFFRALLSSPKKERVPSRGRLFLVAGGFLWVLFRILLEPFQSSLDKPLVFVALAFLVVVLAGLTFILEWPSKRWFLGGALAVVPVFLVSSLNFGYGTGLGVLQRAAVAWSSKLLLPLVLVVVTICSVGLIWEKRKDLGRRAVAGAWGACALLLLGMISFYPWAATLRKGHGIFDASRKAWLGWSEPRTLNGLSFIRKENPWDDAAIKFLQERVPGQPCLVEFVGEGYNSWASRFSIFTGIPALMGWDGHVGEWVGARRGDDIRARFNATERIFRTTDPSEAKKYMDAYGVRLVMVGTVERNGVPGRKGGYPSEGLAKFAGMLPLIYRNPQVEIYFNPPSE